MRTAWRRLRPGLVEGRPALLASDRPDAEPDYFILLTWKGQRIASISDYRYASHVLSDADDRAIGRHAYSSM